MVRGIGAETWAKTGRGRLLAGGLGLGRVACGGAGAGSGYPGAARPSSTRTCGKQERRAQVIMRRGQQLLLPANGWFVSGSLILALLLNMVQGMGLWGRAAWTPDVLALVLVFWTVHQPLRVVVG